VRLRHLRGGDVGELLSEARERYPANLLIVFLEARYLVDHGRFEEALACFRRLLAVDTSVLPDAGPAYDARIFGSLSHDGCGSCLFRLGRCALAAEAWGAAGDASPGDSSFASKRLLALAKVRGADG
jgi:tetratricopeptide (TPR) repeat protein